MDKQKEIREILQYARKEHNDDCLLCAVKDTAIDKVLSLIQCETCGGAGEVWDMQEFGGRECGDLVPCPDCHPSPLQSMIDQEECELKPAENHEGRVKCPKCNYLMMPEGSCGCPIEKPESQNEWDMDNPHKVDAGLYHLATQQHKEEFEQLQQQLEKAEEEIKKYIKMDEYKSQQSILSTENYIRICKQVEQLQQKLEKTEEYAGGLENAQRFLDEKIENLQQKLEKSEKESAELKKLYFEYKKSYNLAKERIFQLEAAEKELKEYRATFGNQGLCQKYEQQIAELQQQLEETEEKLKIAKNEYVKLGVNGEKELLELEQQLTVAKTEIENCKVICNGLEIKIAEKDKKIEALEKLVKHLGE